jgi:hypothetical protein
MNNPNRKFERFLLWVDQLPSDCEFTFLQAKQATSTPIGSLQSILPTLCKNGLMSRRENGKMRSQENSRSLLYSKAPDWSLEKAVKANHERLRIKYKKSTKCLKSLAGAGKSTPIDHSEVIAKKFE